MIPGLVLCFGLLLTGYVSGRVHSWFLELLWRASAGKRLRAVARLGNTVVTEQAIADVLEMPQELDHG